MHSKPNGPIMIFPYSMKKFKITANQWMVCETLQKSYSSDGDVLTKLNDRLHLSIAQLEKIIETSIKKGFLELDEKNNLKTTMKWRNVQWFSQHGSELDS